MADRPLTWFASQERWFNPYDFEGDDDEINNLYQRIHAMARGFKNDGPIRTLLQEASWDLQAWKKARERAEFAEPGEREEFFNRYHQRATWTKIRLGPLQLGRWVRERVNYLRGEPERRRRDVEERGEPGYVNSDPSTDVSMKGGGGTISRMVVPEGIQIIETLEGIKDYISAHKAEFDALCPEYTPHIWDLSKGRAALSKDSVIVYTESGEVKGFAHVSPQYKKRILFVELICADKNRGIGSLILKAAEDMARRDLGYGEVRLAAATREVAKFYHKNGFTFTRDDDDELMMAKEFDPPSDTAPVVTAVPSDDEPPPPVLPDEMEGSGKMVGGMMAARRMVENKTTIPKYECVAGVGGFLSHYVPEKQALLLREHFHGATIPYLSILYEIFGTKDSYSVKSTKMGPLSAEKQKILDDRIDWMLRLTQQSKRLGVYTFYIKSFRSGHIVGFICDPETDTLAFFDPKEQGKSDGCVTFYVRHLDIFKWKEENKRTFGFRDLMNFVGKDARDDAFFGDMVVYNVNPIIKGGPKASAAGRVGYFEEAEDVAAKAPQAMRNEDEIPTPKLEPMEEGAAPEQPPPVELSGSGKMYGGATPAERGLAATIREMHPVDKNIPNAKKNAVGNFTLLLNQIVHSKNEDPAPPEYMKLIKFVDANNKFRNYGRVGAPSADSVADFNETDKRVRSSVPQLTLVANRKAPPKDAVPLAPKREVPVAAPLVDRPATPPPVDQKEPPTPKKRARPEPDGDLEGEGIPQHMRRGEYFRNGMNR